MDADEAGVKRSSSGGSCSALLLIAPPVGVTVPSALHVPSTGWHSFLKAAHGGDSPAQAFSHVHSGVSGQAVVVEPPAPGATADSSTESPPVFLDVGQSIPTPGIAVAWPPGQQKSLKSPASAAFAQQPVSPGVAPVV